MLLTTRPWLAWWSGAFFAAVVIIYGATIFLARAAKPAEPNLWVAIALIVVFGVAAIWLLTRTGRRVFVDRAARELRVTTVGLVNRNSFTSKLNFDDIRSIDVSARETSDGLDYLVHVTLIDGSSVPISTRVNSRRRADDLADRLRVEVT